MLYSRAKKFTLDEVPDQTGKIALITGSNTGLGFEAAKMLAFKNARVILACRDFDKAHAARLKILSDYPNARVDVLSLDLGDLSSIHNAVEQLKEESHLDLLINNAGIMVPPYELTRDGFESQFGVNHLGHFVLTCLLYDKLNKTQGARVVTVSSIMHWPIKRIDFDDIHAKCSYRRVYRYGMSKLSNLLFTYELNRKFQARNSNLMAIASHPGASNTELIRYFPKWIRWIIEPFIPILISSAQRSALTTIRAATDPNAYGGAYYGPRGIGQISGLPVLVKSSRVSYDRNLAQRLWERSVSLTQVDLPEVNC